MKGALANQSCHWKCFSRALSKHPGFLKFGERGVRGSPSGFLQLIFYPELRAKSLYEVYVYVETHLDTATVDQ